MTTRKRQDVTANAADHSAANRPRPEVRPHSAPGSEPSGRRPYEPPRVEVVGNVSEITMGSVGTAPESGGGFFTF